MQRMMFNPNFQKIFTILYTGRTVCYGTIHILCKHLQRGKGVRKCQFLLIFIARKTCLGGHTFIMLACRGTQLVRKIGQNANLVNRSHLVNMLTRLVIWSKTVKNVLNQLKYGPLRRRWMGEVGVQNSQKLAYVIYEWSLS